MMKTERWALLKAERDSGKLPDVNSELLGAVYPPYVEESGIEEFVDPDPVYILFNRRGEPTNRFDDGTVGVPDEIIGLAKDVDDLYAPITLEQAVWANVDVDASCILL